MSRPQLAFSQLYPHPLLLLKIVDKEFPSIEFPQEASLSFPFAFRAPSETLQLQRAYYTDQLAAFTPQAEKAPIGVREEGGLPFLICNLSRRKNLISGCTLHLPCFCALTSRRAASICPVHVSWQLVHRRVAPGKFLLTAIDRRNFNRVLKKVSEQMGTPDALRYSSHGFRRGATQELKEPG